MSNQRSCENVQINLKLTNLYIFKGDSVKSFLIASLFFIIELTNHGLHAMEEGSSDCMNQAKMISSCVEVLDQYLTDCSQDSNELSFLSNFILYDQRVGELNFVLESGQKNKVTQTLKNQVNNWELFKDLLRKKRETGQN